MDTTYLQGTLRNVIKLCVLEEEAMGTHVIDCHSSHNWESKCVVSSTHLTPGSFFSLSISGFFFGLAIVSGRLSSQWSKMGAEAPHLATYSGKRQESLLEAQQNSHWLGHLPLTQPITMTEGMWPHTNVVFSVPDVWRIREAIEPSGSRLEEKLIVKGLLWDIGQIGVNGKKKIRHPTTIAHDEVYQPTLTILNTLQVSYLRINGPRLGKIFLLKSPSAAMASTRSILYSHYSLW